MRPIAAAPNGDENDRETSSLTQQLAQPVKSLLIGQVAMASFDDRPRSFKGAVCMVGQCRVGRRCGAVNDLCLSGSDRLDWACRERMVPSLPPDMRTFHLLKAADILCANDSQQREGKELYNVGAERQKKSNGAKDRRVFRKDEGHAHLDLRSRVY